MKKEVKLFEDSQLINNNQYNFMKWHDMKEKNAVGIGGGEVH